ncbi:Multidrug resistance protein Stp [Ralstonia mannitolilytica]|uniref:MFS transporter n=1 Tax=Ralstonia mannitolilytica TaxID=105219 RepID=UPI0028F4F191|nr:MFS transporter [Ralstonia mannitolilytica]CAJ0698582.1 Multidrug resistance protein Stp [Ralstonia mannitolilytica]
MHTQNRLKKRLALGLLAFAHLIISLDYTIVFVALPDIARELHFSSQTMQWIVSSYVVPYGGLLLLGGRCCDLLGRKRMFLLGLVLFALASAAGGLASDPVVLIVARGVQGLGGAVLFPATLSLIGTMFEEGPRRNRALSVWAGVGGSGMALGALLGGVLTQTFGWPAIFFVNVPLCAAACLITLFVLPRDQRGVGGGRFDLPGALTGTAGIILLVLALVEGPELGWQSGTVVGAAIGALLLHAAFFAIERRVNAPLVPLGILRNATLSTGLSVILLFTSSFGAILYFLAIYFQGALGFDGFKTGLGYLLPYGLIFVASSSSGPLGNRFGMRRILLLGIAVGGAGMLALALAATNASGYGELIPGLTLYSIGMGLTFPMMFAAATSGVQARDQGVASGLASTCQQVGSALGLALLVPLFNLSSFDKVAQAGAASVAQGFQYVNLASFGVVLVMMVIVVATSGARLKHQGQTSEATTFN